MVRPKPLSPSQIITTPGAKLSKIVIAVLSKSVTVPLSHNSAFPGLQAVVFRVQKVLVVKFNQLISQKVTLCHNFFVSCVSEVNPHQTPRPLEPRSLVPGLSGNVRITAWCQLGQSLQLGHRRPRTNHHQARAQG